jgi:hypothetical protein
VTATIRVGSTGQTAGLLYANGSVWSAAYNANKPATLVRVDPSTNRVVARISVGAMPTFEFWNAGLAYGDGSIWVTGVPVPGRWPHALLQRIDPTTNRITATVNLPGRIGTDVAIDATSAWVATEGKVHASVARIDLATDALVATIPLKSNYPSRILSVDGSIVVQQLFWHDNQGPCGVLTVIDPATDRVTGSHPAPDACTGGKPFVAAGRLWNVVRAGLREVDPSTGLPIGRAISVPVKSRPRSFILADGSAIWYESGPHGFTRLDLKSGHRVKFQVVNGGGYSAVLSVDSIWTLNFEGVVTRVDLA